jgi:hypothetical protein
MQCGDQFGASSYLVSGVRKNIDGDVCIYESRFIQIEKGKKNVSAWDPNNDIDVWMKIKSSGECPKANTTDYVRTGGISAGTFSLLTKGIELKFSDINRLEKEIKQISKLSISTSSLDKFISDLKSNKKIRLKSLYVGSGSTTPNVKDSVLNFTVYEPLYNFSVEINNEIYEFTFDFCHEKEICLLGVDAPTF